MPGGQADCLKCKHASDFEEENFKVISIKCKARDQTMTVFKDFFCWFYEPK